MIVFTLCSNNYLAQAKTLGDSFLQHNPGDHFVIGLVDRLRDDVDYGALGPFEILAVDDLGIPSFEGFWRRYSVIELNTAVKPYYFTYLFERDDPDVVMYFDPDTELYASCQVILDELGDGSILLTPHALSPMPDNDLGINEGAFLNCGIYNLGFIGVANRTSRVDFLDWWRSRTARWGYVDLANGLFVDQLWINLAPLYFEGVKISRHPGLNMAYWNLHERVLSEGADGSLMVNIQYPLVFFHFSAFDPLHPESIATHQNRFTLATRPDIDGLFRSYASRLHENGYARYSGIGCTFDRNREQYLEDMRCRYTAEQFRRAPVKFLTVYSARQCIRVLRRVLDFFDAPLRRRFPGPGDGRR